MCVKNEVDSTNDLAGVRENTYRHTRKVRRSIILTWKNTNSISLGNKINKPISIEETYTK